VFESLIHRSVANTLTEIFSTSSTVLLSWTWCYDVRFLVRRGIEYSGEVAPQL
jgi:hypothetical protein